MDPYIRELVRDNKIHVETRLIDAQAELMHAEAAVKKWQEQVIKLRDQLDRINISLQED